MASHSASTLSSSLPRFLPARDRRWYLEGHKVNIWLYGPKSNKGGKQKCKQVSVSVSDRLLHLYTPSLTANVLIDKDTGARTLRLKITTPSSPPSLMSDTISDIEEPALSKMLIHLTNLMYGNSNWNVLPAFDCVEKGVLIYVACCLLHLHPGVANTVSRLKTLISRKALSANDVKSLWYVFGTSQDWINAAIANIASFSFLKKLPDDEYILWFFETELSHEEREDVLGRIKREREQCEIDAEEERWRASLERKKNIIAWSKRIEEKIYKVFRCGK